MNPIYDTTKIHKFEKAGLGKAPFKVIGFYTDGEVDYSLGGHHPSCQYCYAQIVNVFIVESSDGKRFHVGPDCVKKTGDKGMELKVKEMLSQARWEKENKDWKWVGEHYKEYTEELKTMKHPYYGSMTMFDYIYYIIDGKHGWYNSTRKKIISAVKKAVKMRGGEQKNG